MVGDTDSEFAAVATTQQSGDAISSGQEEGFACWPLSFKLATVGLAEGLQQGL